ncbi:uncharacterized protein [Arachis hypogaea]|uniref:uncharacterized protein n=1 Tax=Arachis hypogaea TaxID=3818 RepID=UPI003B222D6A
MYNNLKAMFWWPSMKNDVADPWRFRNGSGRALRWILYWDYRELGPDSMLPGEKSLLGPELIAETTEQVKKIRDRMLTAQSRQKSYADQRRKPLEFEKGDHAFLEVTPTIGVGRAIKTKKLNPRYIGPFQILERVGHVLEPESVQLKEDLTLPVTPVRVDDTSIKKLRGKEVSLVKVTWSRVGFEEHTWKLESEMRADYPHLFSGN